MIKETQAKYKTLQQKASCLLRFVRFLPQKIERSKKMFRD